LSLPTEPGEFICGLLLLLVPEYVVPPGVLFPAGARLPVVGVPTCGFPSWSPVERSLGVSLVPAAKPAVATTVNRTDAKPNVRTNFIMACSSAP